MSDTDPDQIKGEDDDHTSSSSPLMTKSEEKIEKVIGLLRELQPFFAQIPKAKTAKIVRSLIDLFTLNPPSTKKLQNAHIPHQLQLVKESIEWAIEEKRSFLKQRLQTRLAQLYLQSKEYQHALSLLNTLLYEVKKVDDKALLVEV
ncbi:hypothetical protein M1146_07580 [Patescibacteria group bacterium]|nr:hypothetical protein [Patescibacteria group bacterium]